jgi:hypothetical protein
LSGGHERLVDVQHQPHHLLARTTCVIGQYQWGAR